LWQKNLDRHNQKTQQKSPKPKKQPKTQPKPTETYATHNHTKQKMKCCCIVAVTRFFMRQQAVNGQLREKVLKFGVRQQL
jgi:hypothetical protein